MQMINAKSVARFNALRKMVDKAVEHAWAQGEPGKSYEGAWEVTCEFPPTDEGGAEKNAVYWQIVLHCYLLWPSRHYLWTGKWTGKTLDEAIDRCEHEVEIWCKAEMEEDKCSD